MEDGQWLHVSASGGSPALTKFEKPVAFPTLFYGSVVYGVSAAHPEGRQADDESNGIRNAELARELLQMWPRPSKVLKRLSRNDGRDWSEPGFAVVFDKASVEAERGILFLARSFGQVRTPVGK